MASLHNCASCEHSPQTAEGDCVTCKLAEIAQGIKKREAEKQQTPLRIDDDDELSISERLTDKKNSDYSILYLVIAAFAVFALVVLFTKLFAS